MCPDTERRRQLEPAELPPVGLGLTSASLAVVGMLLFWLPVLGASISAAALMAGLVGLAVRLLAGVGSLRWCLRGAALSLLALTVSLAIYFAPKGYRPPPDATPRTAPVPTAENVPPPAPP